jgi:hypothetical protein
MSDVPVVTNQAILTHQPDIVLHDEKEKTCLLIDISIPDDSKFNTKETEKLSKYKDLEIKVSRMWKVSTKIVSVIIETLGTIKKGRSEPSGAPRPPVRHRTTKDCTSTAHHICRVLG